MVFKFSSDFEPLRQYSYWEFPREWSSNFLLSLNLFIGNSSRNKQLQLANQSQIISYFLLLCVWTPNQKFFHCLFFLKKMSPKTYSHRGRRTPPLLPSHLLKTLSQHLSLLNEPQNLIWSFGIWKLAVKIAWMSLAYF